MVEKLKIDFKISGTKISIPFEAICSITDKNFGGVIISEYHPNNEVIEYVSLEDFIKNITKKKLTAEELANLVFQEISNLIAPVYLNVLVDVKTSDAHQPTKVWIESEKR
jgi:NADPH-dependent 7-cyano-7-deazaguanine reductase QueF